MKKLITEKCFAPMPEQIIWCYTEWQNAYAELQDQVRFCDRLMSPDELDPGKRYLIIFDDMLGIQNDVIVRWFIRGVHHRNSSVVYIVQNLYSQDRNHRTCALNASYTIVFRNIRDSGQITHLARQMFPAQGRYFMDAYKDATAQPFGYLLIDTRTQTPDHLRLRTNVTDVNRQVVYVPDSYKCFSY